MLKAAQKDFEARSKPAPAASAGKATLDKILFPSSSPRDANLSDYYAKPAHTTFQPAGRPASLTKSRPAASTNAAADGRPLGARSPNIQKKAPARSSSLMSICAQSGTFSDEVAVPVPKAQPISSESVLLVEGFDPDDITDDENLNLDLDYQLPGSLPSAPAKAPAPTKPVTAATAASAETAVTATAAAAATTRVQRDESDLALAWSSSPPSHYQPPAHRHQDERHGTSKRSSADAEGIEAPVPAAKKRTMPKHWSKVKDEDGSAAVTPDKKTHGSLPWDASASAIKAQKKQIKGGLKKEAGGGGGGEDQAGKAAGKSGKATAITLSGEQQQVKNLVCVKGASVFFTGPAGTGKSVLMRAIIQDLKKKYRRDPEMLGVTASTGLAACNIGGMTLHSFAGIGLGKEDVDVLIKKIRRNPKARSRWLKTKTLVIDEVSMVDGDLFDKLSQIGRKIRGSGRPWGGIQLVLTGDFFQLPPVPDREKRDVKFAFEANTWATSIDHTIGLTEVFRQRDPEFAEMLNEMRLGRISEKTVQTFKSLARPLQFNDGLEVTELFPTRGEVDSSNERRLRALTGKPFRFGALDTGDMAVRDKLLANMMAPKAIELKQGAQVMLIKNMDETLVNGSLGTVARFMTENEYEDMTGGENGAGAAEDDGMSAESRKRAKLLKSYLHEGSSKGAGAGGAGAASGAVYPYVLFHAVDGSQRGVLVRPEEWTVELPTGEVQASRRQLPLILAWALSIHKAQGQTLERVKVDLGRVFEKGQAYVALSRATTKAGLQVLRFEKHKVMAHPRVIGFYSKLYSADTALRHKGDASILAYTRRAEHVLEPVGVDEKWTRPAMEEDPEEDYEQDAINSFYER